MTQTEGARAAGQHERAQGIDDVGQRIQMRNGLQPAGHDGGGINRVAGKEQRHGEHLADSHKAFARLYNARDDERKRREQRRGKDNDDQHVEERERAPIQLHPEQQRETVNDDRLRERADTSGEALAEHERRARSRAGEEFLHDAQVALPDDVDAIKYGHKENALRQDAGSNEVQIGNVARVHRPSCARTLGRR